MMPSGVEIVGFDSKHIHFWSVNALSEVQSDAESHLPLQFALPLVPNDCPIVSSVTVDPAERIWRLNSCGEMRSPSTGDQNGPVTDDQTPGRGCRAALIFGRAQK